jgi:hypothetical protein
MAERDITNLESPEMNLRFRQEGNKIYVDLPIPRSSGSSQQTPFLEVTRNENQALLNESQRKLIEGLNAAGFNAIGGSISYENNTGGSLGANIRGVGRAEITLQNRNGGNVNFDINTGAVGRAVANTERRFDEYRENIYDQRCKEWVMQGGARIQAGDGNTYNVTPEAAKEYHNRGRVMWRIDDNGNYTPNPFSQNNGTSTQDVAYVNRNQFTGTAYEGLAGNIDQQLGSSINLNGRDRNDITAALLNNPGVSLNGGPINILQSEKDPNLIAPSQAGLRGDTLNMANVPPGSAQTVSQELLNQSRETPQQSNEEVRTPRMA